MKLDRSEPIVAELCFLTLSMIVSGQNPEELEHTKTWANLARYNQEQVRWYRRGVIDLLSRQQGLPISVSARTRKSRSLHDVPKEIQALQPDAAWCRHENGGGWVSDTAQVDLSVFMARGTAVYERAKVLGKARLTGSAVVCGDAIVHEEARVANAAIVHENAVVGGRAIVSGQADIRGHVRLGGDIRIAGEMVLQGDLKLGVEEVPRMSGIRPTAGTQSLAPSPELGSPGTGSHLRAPRLPSGEGLSRPERAYKTR